MLWLALGSKDAASTLSFEIKDTAEAILNCSEPGLYFLACVHEPWFGLSMSITNKEKEVPLLYLNTNYPMQDRGGAVAVFSVEDGETGNYKLRLSATDTGRIVMTLLRNPIPWCQYMGSGCSYTLKLELTTKDDPVIFLLAEKDVDFRIQAPYNKGIIPITTTSFKCEPFFVPISGEYAFVIKAPVAQKVIFAVFNMKGALNK